MVSGPGCLSVKPLSLGLMTRFSLLPVAGLLMWGVLSDDRMRLLFTVVAGPRQRSLSWVRVP
jgi:hypothetical protein